MNKGKTKAKKMTFRQRIRAQSAERLDKIAALMTLAGERVCDEAETEINSRDVMRLICSNQSKTVREQLITDLSNEVEDELEKIYNKQQDLTFGTKEKAA